MPRGKKTSGPKLIVSTKFNDKRVGIPTAEESSYAERLALMSTQLKYPRNPDLDPQLVWRGKDKQDEHPLEVRAYPIYIQFRRRSIRRHWSMTSWIRPRPAERMSLQTSSETSTAFPMAWTGPTSTITRRTGPIA